MLRPCLYFMLVVLTAAQTPPPAADFRSQPMPAPRDVKLADERFASQKSTTFAFQSDILKKVGGPKVQ